MVPRHLTDPSICSAAVLLQAEGKGLDLRELLKRFRELRAEAGVEPAVAEGETPATCSVAAVRVPSACAYTLIANIPVVRLSCIFA